MFKREYSIFDIINNEGVSIEKEMEVVSSIQILYL